MQKPFKERRPFGESHLDLSRTLVGELAHFLVDGKDGGQGAGEVHDARGGQEN